ncbi:MAG: CoA-binding protein [Qingshengfaniella sp.]
MTPSDDTLRQILTRTKVIACVGASPNPARPSNGVGRFLAARGYRVIPVNPGQAGATLFGETVVARLSDIPPAAGVDMIDIFRRSDQVLPIVEEALSALPALRTVWMQLGVTNPQAAALAHAHGLDVIENRCPAIDYPRLIGA